MPLWWFWLVILLLFPASSFAQPGRAFQAITWPDCSTLNTKQGGIDVCFSSSHQYAMFVWSDSQKKYVAGPVGGGSVNQFSSGDLPPLFTTNVDSPLTSPQLTFSKSNFSAHTFYGNNTGSTGPPGAVPLTALDLPGTGPNPSVVGAIATWNDTVGKTQQSANAFVDTLGSITAGDCSANCGQIKTDNVTGIKIFQLPNTAGEITVLGNSRQGTGTKFQMFSGATPVPGDCPKYDAFGNLMTSGGACEVPLNFTSSLARSVNAITLVGDVASPGANKCYSTDATGNRGWFDCTIGTQNPPSVTITNVSPNSGTTAGGVAGVVITGTTLTGASAVTFGGTAATITGNNATSITVTTPAHAAGAVNVAATVTAGSASLNNAYTYTSGAVGGLTLENVYSANNFNQTNLSFVATGSINANSFMVVIVGARSTDNPPAATAATFNGVTMSKLGHDTWGDCANSCWEEIFYLASPASGSHTLTVSVSGAYSLAATAYSFSGANPSTPLGTIVTQAQVGTDPTCATSTTATDIVVCGTTFEGGSPLAKTGAGSEDQSVYDTNNTQFRSGHAAGTGSSVSVSWHSSSSDQYVAAGVAVKSQ